MDGEGGDDGRDEQWWVEWDECEKGHSQSMIRMGGWGWRKCENDFKDKVM